MLPMPSPNSNGAPAQAATSASPEQSMKILPSSAHRPDFVSTSSAVIVSRSISTSARSWVMAPRAHWKGYLRLSLVSCPIALYPAIAASERISFRQVNRVTGNRLRHQLVDSVTGEVVHSRNKGRGYEVGENQHLMVLDEELEAVQQEARSRP